MILTIRFALCRAVSARSAADKCQGYAKVTEILLSTETTVGGPYRTWLVPPDSEPVWLDVDIAVNSNVAYFLTLLAVTLPKLSRFIDDAIIAKA